MKKLVILCTLSAIVILMALSLPLFASASLPTVSVIQTQNKTFTDKVVVSGKINEVEKSDIKTDLPIVPKTVYVAMGEKVKVGDVIADIDVEKSKQAVLSMASMYDAIPASLSGLLASVDINQEKIAKMIPSKIVADYSGTISTINLKKGAVLAPTETAVTISNLTQLQAVLSVPEEYANKVKLGQSVLLSVSALPDKVFPATVVSISVSAHEEIVGTSRQTVTNIYAKLNQYNQEIKSGYSTTGTIFLGKPQSMITLPYEAINQDDEGREYVYLYNSGKATMRSIITGKELSDCVQVLEGVEPSDWIIQDHNRVVKNRQYVNIKETKDD